MMRSLATFVVKARKTVYRRFRATALTLGSSGSCCWCCVRIRAERVLVVSGISALTALLTLGKQGELLKIATTIINVPCITQ